MTLHNFCQSGHGKEDLGSSEWLASLDIEKLRLYCNSPKEINA